jgi:hypothetical protein
MAALLKRALIWRYRQSHDVDLKKNPILEKKLKMLW